MIGRLGCRNACAMTGRTVGIVYTQMVKCNAGKGSKVIDVMTGRTIQCGGHMVVGFSKADITIVARLTIIDDA